MLELGQVSSYLNIDWYLRHSRTSGFVSNHLELMQLFVLYLDSDMLINKIVRNVIDPAN
jgi:hypothetical protein